MTTLTLDKTVGQLVTEHPDRSRIFERLGIDYCCGGKRSLKDACERLNLDPSAVLRELESADAAGSIEEETDWSTAPLGELVDHIVTTHHGYLREALPRLAYLAARVATVHGEAHPELRKLQRVYNAFQRELDQHMEKEERVLFPLCRELETARVLPEFHCGSVNLPILRMMVEHQDAGDALARMRELTNDFTPPADACNTYRAMLAGLAELERDMHQHVHKENNILFPRAAAAEAALGGSGWPG
jgi:regulator of cell morphogenesis and NO signaling